MKHEPSWECYFYAGHECRSLKEMVCRERECPFFRTREEMEEHRLVGETE